MLVYQRVVVTHLIDGISDRRLLDHPNSARLDAPAKSRLDRPKCNPQISTESSKIKFKTKQ